ncbi:MAG TPA: CDP-alcohol phosphatidyltransferase family protein [Planctomycetaceae bacterium]|nr:CDP-alcohol phosphatidyltransferase family protein [Planctomycetaceae bacterium]
MSEPKSAASPRKLRHRKVFAVLPTLLTLCNAACGFGAISIAAKVGPDHFQGLELFTAAKLIFLAMLFDALDGSAARLTNQTSDFGAQLDSLCDAISFGVAPAFLMLQLVHPDHHRMDMVLVAPYSYLPQILLEILPRILWAIAVLFMWCALLRLGRFNVETDEDDSHDSFSGLPSPAAAGVVASFPIAIQILSTGKAVSWVRPAANYLLPALIIVVPLITLAAALLMVSRIRYAHLFNQMIRGRRSRKQILQIVFALVVLLVFFELAIPVLFCAFAFAAPIRALWERYYLGRRILLPVDDETKAA